MRLSALLLLLAASMLPSFADTPYSVAYQASFIVPKGFDYAVVNSTLNGSSAYIVLSSNQVFAVLFPGALQGKFEPSTDAAEIERALQSYYYSLGHSPDAALGIGEVHAKIRATERTHKAGEAACRVLLGTDRFACNSFDSCQKACYSVTSFCLPVALGADRPFINTIWAFENSSIGLDAAYREEEAAYSAWQNNSTAQALGSYLESIGEINRAATAASQSPLYDWYSYCFRPDYSLSNLTNLQIDAQRLYSNSSRFLSISYDAWAASQFTLDGIKKRLQSELEFNRSLRANLSAKQNLTAPAAPSSSQQQPASQQAQEGIIALAGGALAILIIAAALLLYLAKKRRRAGNS